MNHGVKFGRVVGVLLLGLLSLGSVAPAYTAENYTGTIDPGDPWTGSVVDNFLDATSTLGVIPNGVRFQADSTIGTAPGAISYIATNPAGSDEVNLNIATQTGQQVLVTYSFLSSRFPLGVNDPSFIIRDIDADTDGFADVGVPNDDEFCDRLELSAFDTSGAAIPATSWQGFFLSGPATVQVVSAVGGTWVLRGNANDTAGTGQVQLEVIADNVGSVEILYSECIASSDPDTDRPGAIGIVGGFNDFDIFTSDLTLQKTWQSAIVADTATVTVTGGDPAVPTLSAVANTANETDTGVAQEVIAGFDYTLVETLGAANLATYSSSLACTGSADTDVTNGVLTVDEADTNIVCTFTNIGPLADLRISKTLVTPAPHFTGQTVTYQIVVTNDGTSAALNVVVTDTPSNLGSISVISSTPGNLCTGLPCSIPTLAAGASETLQVTAIAQ